MLLRALAELWGKGCAGSGARTYFVHTRDGWRLAVHRYQPAENEHRTPVILCHGMGSNRWNMDGPGKLSLARYLCRAGYDVWVAELRGAGRSTRPSFWNGKQYTWTFEDYVVHDAPAILRLVLRHTGASRVHWVGHSMGGMIAYALLMSPIHVKIASAVTLGSPMMSRVGHPILDLGVPYRWLLRYLPDRVPVGTLARLAAPAAGLLLPLLEKPVHELGWHRGNVDVPLLRSLMLLAVEDLPASLLREFARWYEMRAMVDRYGLFHFADHVERITTPLLIVAGSRDHLTPAEDLREVYERVGSVDKEFRVIGRATGARTDYAHADLILGLHAGEDVYPLILDWLDRHRAQPDNRRQKLEQDRRTGKVTRLRTQRGALSLQPGA